MRPLEGLKVLDFCWVAAGPMTTEYLVEYGATVVRIESQSHPDTLHNSPPFGSEGRGPNRSGYYANYNASKYAFGLNMSHPQAIDIVQRLVPWADLVTGEFYSRDAGEVAPGHHELCATQTGRSSCSARRCSAVRRPTPDNRVLVPCWPRSVV